MMTSITHQIIEETAQELICRLQDTPLDLHIIDNPDTWKFLGTTQEWKFTLKENRHRVKRIFLAYIEDGAFVIRWSAKRINRYELADPAFPDNMIDDILFLDWGECLYHNERY
jgi:hypothetical protein